MIIFGLQFILKIIGVKTENWQIRFLDSAFLQVPVKRSSEEKSLIHWGKAEISWLDNYKIRKCLPRAFELL